MVVEGEVREGGVLELTDARQKEKLKKIKKYVSLLLLRARSERAVS